jgi:hypothetical protein
MIDPRDLEQLAFAGIDATEAERQLALLRDPPRPLRLARACTLDDGVTRLSPRRYAELVERGKQARSKGRLSKFVPASGAATRMFRSLLAVRTLTPDASYEELADLGRTGNAEARDTVAFVDSLPRMALAGPLADALGVTPETLVERSRRERLGDLLSALLDPSGLDAASSPKALLPFHAAAEGPRTALVEQLVEGLEYLADDDTRARFHFTIPPGAAPRFESELVRGRQLLADRARLEVDLSEQQCSTDTLALDEAGGPARGEDGRLLLRPSGHGALLANLEATGADLVVIKNIDNVLPESRHALIAGWQLALVGRLVELEEAGSGRRRPLRVCGVVPNAGEPGGGPFWVERGEDQVGLQIVESSQVDLDDPGQRAIWESSTHFNPVDLVCALRGVDRRPHSLTAFVDPATSFVATRSHGRRPIRVLERPGLWNGAMTGWETYFVELPAETFAPVKTVLDLSRDAHAVDL